MKESEESPEEAHVRKHIFYVVLDLLKDKDKIILSKTNIAKL